MKKLITLTSIILIAAFISSCQSAYYSAMETVGYHKREILVDRVEDANEAQEDAQEEFQSALDQFRSVVEFDGGELESQYNKLNGKYEDSVDAAELVSDRIEGIENVAGALFKEWQKELDEYSSPRLRADSARKLSETEFHFSLKPSTF